MFNYWHHVLKAVFIDPNGNFVLLHFRLEVGILKIDVKYLKANRSEVK